MLGLRESLIALRVVILLIACAMPTLADEPEKFPLEETAVFDDAEGSATDPQLLLMRYQAAEHRMATCGSTPAPGVVYPELRSAKPLYGFLSLSNAAADQVHFVLDESEPAGASTEENGASLMRELADSLVESPRVNSDVKNQYDLLYIDINGDRDLTNDPPLRPMRDPPKFPAGVSNNSTIVVFDYLEINPVGDGEAFARPMRFLSWLHRVPTPKQSFPFFAPQQPGAPIAGAEQTRLIVTPTTIRTGRIRFGETWYQAMLSVPMRGPATRLLVQLELAAAGDAGRGANWRQIPLGRHQTADGFYDIAVDPSGDAVSIGPYQGPMGEFHVDLGGRGVEPFGAAGALQTATGSIVWIGEPNNRFPTERPHTCQLPVGDYRFAHLTVACGDLLAQLSPNQQRLPALGNTPPAGVPAFPVAIREDQPYRLSFADQPEVMFINPPAQSRPVYRRGTNVSIRAMLIDPSLNFLIRGLNDTTNKLQDRPYPTESGSTQLVPVYASLVPQVSITSSAGNVVANGLMPFG